MATIKLVAASGHHLRREGAPFTSTVYNLRGAVDTHTREIRTLADVTAAVTAFGERVAAAHPGRSFYVTVTVARGSRKPSGFDAAEKADAFGTNRWMQTITEQASQPMVAPSSIGASSST